jgi:hypothetical protein
VLLLGLGFSFGMYKTLNPPREHKGNNSHLTARHTRARAMSRATAASSGRVRARAEDGDGVPEHLKCSVCLDAPSGRIEQCTNGEHTAH